jgi:hypothetical protein
VTHHLLHPALRALVQVVSVGAGRDGMRLARAEVLSLGGAQQVQRVDRVGIRRA